jgi:hypothetical protein
VIIIYINNMTIAILIHKSVNCKCGFIKMMNKDDEGRGDSFVPSPLRGRKMRSTACKVEEVG